MPVRPLSYYRDRYIRFQPSPFCAGCGGGIVLNCFVRAIDELGVPPDKVLCVSGIGCSSWIPSPNFRGDTMHTPHGRALAYATGAKVFNSDLVTVVFTGDGDGAGIGGNHLIHAARRNIDITTILVNNLSYAMTGGQMAPTTLYGKMTATSPYGNPEGPFDLAELAAAAGATYVARWTTYHAAQLTRSIGEALGHGGFSFIEVLSQCPTQQRRLFEMRGPVRHVPSRILEMFSESTYVRGSLPKGSYVYAVPRGAPGESLRAVEGAVEGLGAEARLVDHLAFGRIVRVDAEDLEEAKERLGGLGAVERLVGPREGKLPLGVFVKRERPEFTETLRRLVERKGGGG